MIARMECFYAVELTLLNIFIVFPEKYTSFETMLSKQRFLKNN